MSLPPNLQSHLNAMFALNHGAATAVFGGLSQGVLFAAGAGDPFGDQMASTDTYSMVYPTAIYPTLRGGNSLTIDGVTYHVIDVNKTDDGASSRATLSLG